MVPRYSLGDVYQNESFEAARHATEHLRSPRIVLGSMLLPPSNPSEMIVRTEGLRQHFAIQQFKADQTPKDQLNNTEHLANLLHCEAWYANPATDNMLLASSCPWAVCWSPAKVCHQHSCSPRELQATGLILAVAMQATPVSKPAAEPDTIASDKVLPRANVEQRQDSAVATTSLAVCLASYVCPPA